MTQTTHCGQQGCGALVAWGRTVRHLNEKTRKMEGGRPMMVDWPLPALRIEAGRLLAAEDGQPVPNLGVRRDQHGTLTVRVLTDTEPLRADEKPGIPHWATCANPPKRTPRRTRKATAPPPRQAALPLGGDAAPTPAPRMSPLSDASLYPRRRRG